MFGNTQSGRGVSTLRANGFTDQAIERLIGVRARYQQGAYSEETLESKRLTFGKWLYEHGRVGESQD